MLEMLAEQKAELEEENRGLEVVIADT